MIAKEHITTNNRLILTVCDKGIIGKKFETTDLKLDLSSDFYKGKEKTEKEIVKLFEQAYMINLVGQRSVELGLKSKIISKKDIIKIKDIPYVQAISSDS
ncbi:hypothetical protein COY26_04070 [Candidatus Woesearchaeota archaeon CG_4_10_14_0_2_um_filter_33_10]|nr:MAG: hypothetical protein AUJ83_00730 [Candidatus Woesearchaeota archaeon CG1_02_33_12]PIN79311.1 MAG: hypothetical protein COV14_00240 [Candidatus Woesearchaeota archaeon CG10_big_fil_rev_8_21_14_0_10_33_12]PIU72732.1 MAG: hypothetical protein COS79_01365 [Candidatus Woesearchaeota archaeon CG06_land_8_20_14_3_00_33_13]PIZ52644.1 MAG: hypothetical protein COY26_04070 [Candidatus Woesearchaeota archaeon CG_4_10_14_0_2_um_filter_33_10]